MASFEPRFDSVRALLVGAVGRAFPAAQLLVCEGGAIVLEEAAGACSESTLFDVASLTKPLVTTTLAMRLVDDGRLSLEDLLRPGVTARLALAHASGLPAWRPLFARIERHASDPCSALIELAQREPLERPPGTAPIYSDLGFLLLGNHIERAGGAPLDAQWSMVAEAFGTGATFHPSATRCAPTRRLLIDPDDPTPPPPRHQRFAEQLVGAVQDDNARAMGGVAGHAGLFACARDVSAIIGALVAAWHGDTKSVITKANTVREFWSPSNIPGSTWCLGWDRPSPNGSQAGAIWPRDGIGHLGFTGCSMWIDPPRRRWVVLLSNRVALDDAAEPLSTLRPALHDEVIRALDGGI